jgi:hypothetical protein
VIAVRQCFLFQRKQPLIATLSPPGSSGVERTVQAMDCMGRKGWAALRGMSTDIVRRQLQFEAF